MLIDKNYWSNFERESCVESIDRRLRKLMRINAIRIDLRSSIIRALTPKLSQEFLSMSTSKNSAYYSYFQLLSVYKDLTQRRQIAKAQRLFSIFLATGRFCGDKVESRGLITIRNYLGLRCRK